MFRQEKTTLITISIVYAIIGIEIDQPTMQTLGMMGWFGLIQLFYCIMSWTRRDNQFISPYVIFLLALYIFSYGQSFLWALGLESERTLIGFRGVTIPEVFSAQVQSIIMLAFFHIGAIHCLTHSNGIYSSIEQTDDATIRLKEIGWLIFVVSFVPYIKETAENMMYSMVYGYGALYEISGKVGFDNLVGFVADYFIPSVICLLVVYKDNIIIRGALIGLLLLNIIVILLTGGRSEAVILLAILVLIYNYLIEKFTRRWLTVGVVALFAMLQILSFVAKARTETGRSVDISEMQIENNAAIDAIAEMGGTMFCLIKTENIVPNKYPYRYGKSYAYALTTVIPNLGFWDIHPAKKESNLGEWLTDELALNYGTGYSMCAEAYANFGYMGFVVFFLWGWFITKVFGKIDICVQTRDYALLAFLLILFWYFLKLPRNSFINLVRPIFFVAGPIYLYCNNFKLRRQ